MKLYENKTYLSDVKIVSEMDLPWEKLQNTSIIISGASGLVGSFLIDVIMMRNSMHHLNCKVLALGRNEEPARERFAYCWDDNNFVFISHDINNILEIDGLKTVDYVVHLASNTHPIVYSTEPISTITTNVIGTRNMLDFAVAHNSQRVLFASSNEIYGENRGDVEKFDEDYCGYIDCNTLRAGYSESKRCGEALCQAYRTQKDLDIVIPRLTRTYGPTMRMSDSKAISQFILKAINGENIVLKSEGNQFYSFTYVADAVSGLLTVLLMGENGQAYNIADDSSDIRLKDLAKLIAGIAGTEVVFELPNEIERAGYSTATKARLESTKIKELGWFSKFNIQSGVDRTIHILSNL